MLLARAPTIEVSRPSPSNHASTRDVEDSEQEPRSWFQPHVPQPYIRDPPLTTTPFAPRTGPSVPPTITSSNGSPMNSYFSDSDKAFVRRRICSVRGSAAPEPGVSGALLLCWACEPRRTAPKALSLAENGAICALGWPSGRKTALFRPPDQKKGLWGALGGPSGHALKC